jgi:hypothetical protein
MYRQCAVTAVFQKSRLEMFTKISLWLAVAGAVIGTAAQFAPANSVPSKILGVVGSLAVALAGVAATQAVSGSRDKIWIKCRALGETLKSSVYRYCASAPPFDSPNRSTALAGLVEKALNELGGIDLQPSPSDKPPPGPLTVADYINVRVDDQIKYYTTAAAKNLKKAEFWRNAAFAGATVAAILGAVSAIFSLAAWVALLATVTASLTAFVRNQRYETMIGLYQSTALRLQLLKDQWLDSGKTEADTADRNSFIQRCEDTMSLENGAWTAQWSQQPPSPAAEAKPPRAVSAEA